MRSNICGRRRISSQLISGARIQALHHKESLLEALGSTTMPAHGQKCLEAPRLLRLHLNGTCGHEPRLSEYPRPKSNQLHFSMFNTSILDWLRIQHLERPPSRDCSNHRRADREVTRRDLVLGATIIHLMAKDSLRISPGAAVLQFPPATEHVTRHRSSFEHQQHSTHCVLYERAPASIDTPMLRGAERTICPTEGSPGTRSYQSTRAIGA